MPEAVGAKCGWHDMADRETRVVEVENGGLIGGCELVSDGRRRDRGVARARRGCGRGAARRDEAVGEACVSCVAEAECEMECGNDSEHARKCFAGCGTAP
jgi:hypothetical protein